MKKLIYFGLTFFVVAMVFVAFNNPLPAKAVCTPIGDENRGGQICDCCSDSSNPYTCTFGLTQGSGNSDCCGACDSGTTTGGDGGTANPCSLSTDPAFGYVPLDVIVNLTLDADELLAHVYPPEHMDWTLGCGNGTIYTATNKNFEFSKHCQYPQAGDRWPNGSVNYFYNWSFYSQHEVIKEKLSCPTKKVVVNGYNLNVSLAGVVTTNRVANLDANGGYNAGNLQINCGSGNNDCSETYSTATTVTLWATNSTADGNSSFSSWTGDCTSINGNQCIVNMNSNKTVTANFVSALNVTLNDNGGTGQVVDVATLPNGAIDVGSVIDCGNNGSTMCSAGGFSSATSTVVLKASSGTYSLFDHWSGPCAISGSKNEYCTVTMSDNKSVAANYVTVDCGTANNHQYGVTDTSYGSFTQCASRGTSNYTGFPAPGASVYWYCIENGVLSSSCTAKRDPIVCGTANGHIYSSGENSFGTTFTLCDPGATSSPVSPTFPAPGAYTAWHCLVGSDTSSECKATRASSTAPTLVFTTNKDKIDIGASAILSWSVQGASSCYGWSNEENNEAYDSWADWKSNTGGTSTVTPSVNRTYTMNCWNTAGVPAGEKTVTVTVRQPCTATLTLDSLSVVSGSKTNLNWSRTPILADCKLKENSDFVDLTSWYYANNDDEMNDVRTYYEIHPIVVPTTDTIGNRFYFLSCSHPDYVACSSGVKVLTVEPPCIPKSCSSIGKNCGDVSGGNGCGNALNCGTCAIGETCENNICGECSTIPSPYGTCGPVSVDNGNGTCDTLKQCAFNDAQGKNVWSLCTTFNCSCTSGKTWDEASKSCIEKKKVQFWWEIVPKIFQAPSYAPFASIFSWLKGLVK